MHLANPYTDQMTARYIRRSTVIDDGPLAFGATVQEKVDAGWMPAASKEGLIYLIYPVAINRFSLTKILAFHQSQ